MKPSTPTSGNVIQFADFKKPDQEQAWIRLAAENDGLCILYSNKYTQSNKFYSMKILCWGLSTDGEVVAIVPWMNHVTSCKDLDDEYYGQWQGYYNPVSQCIFDEAPQHKVLELDSAADFFGELDGNPKTIIQEIPDNIGTHAMLNTGEDQHLILTDILSWRLLGDGHLEAMMIDEEKVTETPILPGDPCLYPASDNPDFRYFFQHHIANQIKSEDPEALAAIALLLDN